MAGAAKMKIYVVGGFCRDTILGKTPKDKDFVVCGATPQDLLELNFKQVGCDFPVFLHPLTNEEFALARQERKTGKGYHGFETDHSPTVTLEDDLRRRDLCCNSVAMEVDSTILTSGEFKTIGGFIDPFNGIQDLKNGILRHVSEAFAEDPLRVLRVARFAARYNFTIAHDTQKLMSKIANSGEMNELPMERVFTEFKKAMMEDYPRRFFDELPDETYDRFFNEICDYNNTGVDFAVTLNSSFEERMMLLCMGMRPLEAKSLFLRLKAPTSLINQVFMSCHLNRMVWEADDLDDLWLTFERANAWKNIPLLQKAVPVHLFWGDESTFKSLYKIMKALHIGSQINFNLLSDEQQETLKGKEISKAISELRFKVISNLF